MTMIPVTMLMAQFINHIRRSVNKVLTISRGQTLFSFGDAASPVTYDKKDISEIVLYGAYKGSEKLRRTEIVFNDGTSINISGMLIDQTMLKSKFPHNTCRRVSKSYPFMPADA